MGERTYTDDDLRRRRGVPLVARRAPQPRSQGDLSAALRSVRVTRSGWGSTTATSPGSAGGPTTSSAVASPRSRAWGQVAVALGLAGGSSSTALKGHALRLGIDAEPLQPSPKRSGRGSPEMASTSRHLPRAGGLHRRGLAHPVRLRGLLAARTLPLRPARCRGRPGSCASRSRRLGATPRESWRVSLSHRRSSSRQPTTPTTSTTSSSWTADFDYYLIPVAVVGGLRARSTCPPTSEFRLAPAAASADLSRVRRDLERRGVDGDELRRPGSA